MKSISLEQVRKLSQMEDKGSINQGEKLVKVSIKKYTEELNKVHLLNMKEDIRKIKIESYLRHYCLKFECQVKVLFCDSEGNCGSSNNKDMIKSIFNKTTFQDYGRCTGGGKEVRRRDAN